MMQPTPAQEADEGSLVLLLFTPAGFSFLIKAGVTVVRLKITFSSEFQINHYETSKSVHTAPLKFG